MIQWKLTMSICGPGGCEMHYAGEYNSTKVQFVRLPKGVSKSGETRIYVAQDENWNTRPEFKSEKELVKYMDANYPPNATDHRERSSPVDQIVGQSLANEEK